MQFSLHPSTVLVLLATLSPVLADNSCCAIQADGLVSGGTSFTSSCCTGGTVKANGRVVRFSLHLLLLTELVQNIASYLYQY